MKWIDDIFSIVWDFWLWLLDEATFAEGWPILGAGIAWILRAVADVVKYALTFIANLGDWVDDIVDTISKVATWDTIKTAIKDWLSGIEDMVTWFSDWWANVATKLGDWWGTVATDVQGWIATALSTAKDLIAGVQKELSDLHTSWDDFWTTTYPTLISSIDASKLIESTLKTWFPFYDDLAELWDGIKEFFVSPLDWLLDHFAVWFLGPEE